MCRIQIFPDDLTIRSRRFASSRLPYGRSKRSAPLTQDLDGVAEVALRRGPVGGHPRTGRGSDSNGAKPHVGPAGAFEQDVAFSSTELRKRAVAHPADGYVQSLQAYDPRGVGDTGVGRVHGRLPGRGTSWPLQPYQRRVRWSGHDQPPCRPLATQARGAHGS